MQLSPIDEGMLISYKKGSAFQPMHRAQRNWCLQEMGKSEDDNTLTDQQLAAGVFQEWNRRRDDYD